MIEPCFGIGHNLSLICQLISEDTKHQLIIVRNKVSRNKYNERGLPTTSPKKQTTTKLSGLVAIHPTLTPRQTHTHAHVHVHSEYKPTQHLSREYTERRLELPPHTPNPTHRNPASTRVQFVGTKHMLSTTYMFSRQRFTLTLGVHPRHGFAGGRVSTSIASPGIKTMYTATSVQAHSTTLTDTNCTHTRVRKNRHH